MLAEELQQLDARLMSPLTLAFLGDSVYELMVRTALLKEGNRPVNKLHQEAVAFVRAATQAAVYDRVYDRLTEKEQDVLRRGRNAHTVRCPKNTDVLVYRKATALESLFGYLYMTGQHVRLEQVFSWVREYMGDVPSNPEPPQVCIRED